LLGAKLGDGLHSQAAVALGEEAERRFAFLVGQLAEDLREVGGMLLLQQVQQVSGRTNAQQSLDRVEHEIDSSLRRHVDLVGSLPDPRDEFPSGPKRLNLARDACKTAVK